MKTWSYTTKQPATKEQHDHECGRRLLENYYDNNEIIKIYTQVKHSTLI